jgi:hypothetical protein
MTLHAPRYTTAERGVTSRLTTGDLKAYYAGL